MPALLLSQAVQLASEKGADKAVSLNPIDLVLKSSGPVFVVFWMLVAMAARTAGTIPGRGSKRLNDSHDFGK